MNFNCFNVKKHLFDRNTNSYPSTYYNDEQHKYKSSAQWFELKDVCLIRNSFKMIQDRHKCFL